jgi:thymidylate synthase (FAD)
MHEAKLVAIHPDPEKICVYCARVSNPANQDNEDYVKLVGYLIKNRHWSPFEMANMILEINTTRAIGPQILRHRSFTFQEFSQRYSTSTQLGSIEMPHLRRQDTKNRQNSIDDLNADQISKYYRRISQIFEDSEHLYSEMVSNGVAKECAREVLPLATPTRLMMNGNLRSWITYIALREKNGTQLEHQKIALSCKKIFVEQCPVIGEALGGLNQPWEL